MSQDNIQTDTPQEGANDNQYNSLEEAVFGNNEATEGSENIQSAFTQPQEGTVDSNAAPQGQPATSEDTMGIMAQDNDQRRYQYWQSQADKLKNENEKLKQNMQKVAAASAQPQPGQLYNEEPEEFPPPPEKPARPRYFSREEANSDPASESAKYLDSVEDWRDDIAEYNTIKTQYEQAKVQERFESMERQRIENAQRVQAAQQAKRQELEIKEHVMGHYGMNEAETADFMQTMSDPQSLNIDNLVQLYRVQKGGAAATQQPVQPQPSATFKQVQNAQQVPTPMGVMPSGNADNDGRSVEDKIMDTMIGNFDSKNPWK